MQILEQGEIFPPILLAKNLGGGIPVFTAKAGQSLNFNTLAEGHAIDIDLTSNLLTLSVNEADLLYPRELGDLDDVDLNTKTPNMQDLLIFNSLTGEWVPERLANLSELNGISINVPNADGQLDVIPENELVRDILYYRILRHSSLGVTKLRTGFLMVEYDDGLEDYIIEDFSFFDKFNEIGVQFALAPAVFGSKLVANVTELPGTYAYGYIQLYRLFFK